MATYNVVYKGAFNQTTKSSPELKPEQFAADPSLVRQVILRRQELTKNGEQADAVAARIAAKYHLQNLVPSNSFTRFNQFFAVFNVPSLVGVEEEV